MAVKGQTDLLLNTLEPKIRGPIQQAFQYVLDNLRIGTGNRAENFQWYPFTSTTASVANTEFSVEHGLNQIPTKLIPFVDVSGVNSQMVTLTVSRAADARRVYLKSPSTSAVFSFLLEV